MSDFKLGDIVQLKSGGPAMTVSGHRGRSLVCEWFDHSGKHSAHVFEPSSLKPYEEPDLKF